jgi:hypothetical protein
MRKRRVGSLAAAGVLAATWGIAGLTTGSVTHLVRYPVSNPLHEAAFDTGHGKEADRRGPSDPVSEQVGDRAYPRNYVDDRRVVAEHAAYVSKPYRLSRAQFHSGAASRSAAKTTPGAWKQLGPITPKVAGLASQFFDPKNFTGPSTQESGRVTALAIDPNCNTKTAPKGGFCRLWVAAAGGGIWRTNNALAAHPTWIAPPNNLPTNSFGSLLVDPNDKSGNTIYAGSGEPNGSGDSEAGLGLFRSTNGGRTWSLVKGSAKVATNRSIGSIAIRPGHPHTILIGTDVARHGSSSVNGGRRTPPHAPKLGVYKSTDNGATFSLESYLSDRTPPNPADPGAGTGSDWFQGGINKLEYDPNSNSTVYAAVFGYGLWRSKDGGATWKQVFHTVNQTDFADTMNPGDTFGDRTEFDVVDLGSKTRIYLGDSSDDLGVADAYRTNDAAAIVGDSGGQWDNTGWTMLSSDVNGTNGFLAHDYCQNAQCGYDDFVASPAGHPDTAWFGGSMNYDELPAYSTYGQGAPRRSNGRAMIRTTNGGAVDPTTVTWHDMTAVLKDPSKAWGVKSGIHPDLHAIAFAHGGFAFVGSDGGVVRVNTTSTVDESASCSKRRWNYDSSDPLASETPLQPEDLLDCQRLLKAVPRAVTSINKGLATLQFQSLSVNPAHPLTSIMGGTQDNGTWSYSNSPTWLESVGGDGGQSGFDARNGAIDYHNYFDATPEVNFHGHNPNTWLAIYDPLQISSESRSFYTPFITDPNRAGRIFTGLQHVWRSNDHGGKENYLIANGCYAVNINLFRTNPCGDWKPIGQDLTSDSFGTSKDGQYVVATARALSDKTTLWAGTRTGRVFITKNVGATPSSVKFHRLDTDKQPGRFVSGIAIDPKDANHAWVSFSGYNAYTPATKGHVFSVRYNPKTHKASWHNLSYDLGDQPVTGIARFGRTGDLYASTDFGVLRLANGSTHWVRAGKGLPMVAVYGLTVSNKADVLYAATHGRGAWRLHLPT